MNAAPDPRRVRDSASDARGVRGVGELGRAAVALVATGAAALGGWSLSAVHAHAERLAALEADPGGASAAAEIQALDRRLGRVEAKLDRLLELDR